jgi:hypothetical protein
MNMECYGCGRPIPDREPYVSMDYHIERTNEGMVVVEGAESFLTTCTDCAPPRQAIVEALRNAGLPVPPHAGER